MAQFTEQQEDLKARTIGALAYPVFLAVVGTSIVTALIIFFVPQFDELFQSLARTGRIAGADRMAAVVQQFAASRGDW